MISGLPKTPPDCRVLIMNIRDDRKVLRAWSHDDTLSKRTIIVILPTLARGHLRKLSKPLILIICTFEPGKRKSDTQRPPRASSSSAAQQIVAPQEFKDPA